MSEAPHRTLLVILALCSYVTSHVVQWDTKNLQPVQGLYVKPSVDGTTGDLYVAASEDSDVKSQWVADQPVNFLPPSQPSAPLTVSTTYTTTTTPNDEVISSQKRAVFTGSPVKYARGEASPACPYPYVPATGTQSATPYDYSNYPYSPFYNPYHFYPYIMSAAAATAAHALKEAGLSEEMTNAILSHTSLWSPSAYSYPGQYGMDVNAWSQGQASTPGPIATQPTPTPFAAVPSPTN